MCVQKRLRRGEWLVKSVPSHRQQFRKPVITRHTMMVSKCLQELINAIQAQRALNTALQLMRSQPVLWRTLLPPLPGSWITQVMLSRKDWIMAPFYFLMSHVPSGTTGLCLTCPSANVKKARHLTPHKEQIPNFQTKPALSAGCPSSILYTFTETLLFQGLFFLLTYCNPL